MQVQIFKPSSRNDGSAASFQIAQKGNLAPLFFVNVVKQFSWNEKNRTGSFAESRKDPSKIISLMFNEFELGEMIHTFRTGLPYSTFHKSPKSNTGISLTSYTKTRYKGKPSQTDVMGFGLSLIRDGNCTFKVPIEPGEAIRLTALFYKFFDVMDAFRKEEFDSYNKPASAHAEPEDTNEEEQDQEDDGPGF
jgi:hypothetical protein